MLLFICKSVTVSVAKTLIKHHLQINLEYIDLENFFGHKICLRE